MSCIREVAIREPLVDVVDAKQIVTNSNTLIDIDLYTVKPEDLNIQTPFNLICKRNDYVQAFVTYFTVSFSKCYKNLGFSTCKSNVFRRAKSPIYWPNGRWANFNLSPSPFYLFSSGRELYALEAYGVLHWRTDDVQKRWRDQRHIHDDTEPQKQARSGL